MRKAIVWILIAMLALSSIGFAEGIVTQKASFNSHDAVRTSTDLYLAVTAPDSGEMLVRVPLAGGEAVCVDRAERFEDLVAYSGGAAYLAVDGGSTLAKCCIGNKADTLYNFGSGDISDLAVYGDDLLVLNEGLLFSFNPNTQVCLKLSSAQMLDYVLGQDCAYYISESDKMEYTAQLGNGETASTQAGCIYRLDLASGETMLLLKSGGTDLQLGGENIYFHNLADAYAVRASETETQLCGRLYSLNTSLKTLNKECADPDSGYWVVDEKPVALYNNALNLMDASGAQQLYKPENGSLTVSDGERLYVWEPSVHKLTEVQTSGMTTMLYGQDLSQSLDADTLVDVQAANEALLETQSPEESPAPDENEMLVPEGETAPEETAASDDWFDQFIGNAQDAGVLDDSAETEVPGPTPIPSEAELKAQQATLVAEGTDEDLTTAEPNVQPAVPVPIAITNDSVKMREGPGSEYAEVASIPAGVSVAYLGEAKSSKLSTWYQVQYKGDVGFIYSKYADLSIGVPTDSGAASADSFADEEIMVEDPFEAALSGSESAAESAPKSSGSTKYSTYKISGSYARIKNGTVNMRTKPGTAFSVITSIPVGTTVTFKGLGAKNNDGSKWYQVQYKGRTGWISQNYATITNSKGSSSETSTAGSTYPMDGKYVYTEGSVNVRTGPSLSHGVITSVPSGTYLNFAKKGSTDSRGVRWYKVTHNGRTGWVSSRYCVIRNSKGGKTGKYVKTTASVNLRKGPGLNYGTIAALSSGTKLTYLGTSKTDSRGVRWYKVSYKGKTCWISSRYSTLIS